MASQTGKTVEVMFENALEAANEQDQILSLVNFSEPDPAKMQNADNVQWKSRQQFRPIIDGWDLTGQATGTIKETYPSILGTPKNDLISQRADDLRDLQFWKDAGIQSGKRQVSELNKSIANAIALQGSGFIRSNTGSGYSFIAEAQALLNETQQYNSGRSFILNDRDTLTFSGDLAARQTVQGRPADTWASGQIGANVAGFNVYTGSYLPNLLGGASPATTVTGDQSFVPEGGSVNTSTGVVTNVDYRSATIPVAASASYNIGDKVTFNNVAVPVQSLGLEDKSETGQPMTFTIVAKPSGTSITVYPKPIAADDPGLSTLELAYANINTQILDTATVERLNVDATNKTNLFFDKSAIEVVGGTIPANLFREFNGNKVSSVMKNGMTMYMLWDGDITTMSFQYRIFCWYGITVANPHNCGVAVSY